MPEEKKIKLVPNGPTTKLSASGKAFRKDMTYKYGPRLRSYIGSMRLGKYDEDLAKEFFPISADFDTGIRVINNHGTLLESFRHDPDKPREVKLDVSDMLFSLGAQHYYSKIEIDHSRFVVLKGNPKDMCSQWVAEKGAWIERPVKKGDVSGSSGAWLADGYKDRDLDRIRIEIERPLTRHDFKNAKDFGVDRLKHHKLGDPTHGFWTPKEALDAALAFFKKSFAPGEWVLRGYYHYGKDDKDEEIEVYS